MAYVKTVYVNDNPPALNADNLNHAEEGIETADANATAAKTEVEDVRTGADGTVYNSAGEAVRTQITNENDRIGVAETKISTIEGDYYAEIQDGEESYAYTTSQGSIAGNGTITPTYTKGRFSDIFVTADLSSLKVNSVLKNLYIVNYSNADGDASHYINKSGLVVGNEITDTWSYDYFRIYATSDNAIADEDFRPLITVKKKKFVNAKKGFTAPENGNAINWGTSGQFMLTDGQGGVTYTNSTAQKWLNKKFMTFGDSITYYDGHTYGQYHKQYGSVAIGYQTWMRNQLNCTVVNEGVSGYSMPEILGEIKTKSYSDVDAVTITSGANDYADITGNTETMGSLQPIGSTFDESSFYGSMQSAIEYILGQKPTIKIYLLTPIKGWFSDGVLPDTFETAIKQIGKLYSLPVCDWYSESGINDITKAEYIGDLDTMTKKLHPNDDGYAMMANILIPFLNNH